MVTKRKKRRKLIFNLTVLHRNSGQLLGYLLDITQEGFMIISENPLELNKIYQIKILLGKEIDGHDYLDCAAKSLWSKKDVNKSYYDTGFKIVDSSIDFKLYQQIILELGFDQ